MVNVDTKSPATKRQGPGRLAEIAANEYDNEPLGELVPRIVEEAGSVYEAARTLGVYPNAIYYQLKKYGYRYQGGYVQKLEAV